MVKAEGQRFEVGDVVLVPWGVATQLTGEIIEVWGDPEDHVRVVIRFERDEPMFIFTRSSLLVPAA
jgi:hypothetical protein